jgi:dipeptidyl aminopeptidase/acylaminoacyl peptidase
MAKALQKANKPVELYIFPSEIHGFKEESNRILFYTSLIGFFDKHLSIVGEDAAIHE